MPKYEISLIPNYGNEEIIINTVKKMGIRSSGQTRPSGFIGCDVPVILDIECSEGEKLKLDLDLRDASTDIYNIIKRCPTCGQTII